MKTYQTAKFFFLIILLVNFPIAFFLVLNGGDPKFWGDITVILTWFSFFFFMLTPLLINDPNFSLSDKFEKICVLWMFASGITHLTWELGWCLSHPTLNEIFGDLVNREGNTESTVAAIYELTKENPWTWAWSVYGVADGRYLNSDTFVVPMEWVTVGEGILNLSSVLILKQRKYLLAYFVIAVSCVMEFYGTILYYATEIVNDFYFVNTNNFIDFFFKFIGMNFLWLIFTIISVYAVYRKIHDLKLDRIPIENRNH